MVLPADVSKASGLRHALGELGLSPHNAAAIGDAENDHALLTAAECGAAVANSVEALKGRADVVTAGDHGAGVAELIDQLLADDLASWLPRLVRHRVALGARGDGQPFHAPAIGGRYRVLAREPAAVLAWVRAFVHELSAAGRQWALVVDCATQLPREKGAFPSNAVHAKTLDEVEETLADPQRSAIVECSALPEDARPAFARALAAQFNRLWGSAGRPHWVIWLDAAALLDRVDALPTDPRRSYGVVLGHAPADEPPPWLADFESATFVGPGGDSRLAAPGCTIRFEPTPEGLKFDGVAPAWSPKPTLETAS
jgi:hypothetical protein